MNVVPYCSGKGPDESPADHAVDPQACPLADSIVREGVARLAAKSVLERLQSIAGGPLDWDRFRASFDRLPADGYMADGGRYRLRRHSVFSVTSDMFSLLPPRPHYQSTEYNALNGGVERWYEPVEPEIARGNVLASVLRWCLEVFTRCRPHAHQWDVEAHQFRIIASAASPGQPTPEGMHRDGVDYVLVMLVSRQNIKSGTTRIACDGAIDEFTLTAPMESVLLDDRRVAHGVTAVTPLDGSLPAHRDVLVVTFKELTV